jgi:hypothetical protein
MTHRHLLAIYSIAGLVTHFGRREMRHDLMTMKIKVHPIFARTAFFTTHQLAIEQARGCEIVDRKGEVEAGSAHALRTVAPRKGDDKTRACLLAMQRD